MTDIAGLCERPRTVSLLVTFPTVTRNSWGRDTRSDRSVPVIMLPDMLLECERSLRALPEGVGDEAGEFKLLNARLVPEGIMFSVTLEDNTLERQAAEIERLRGALRNIQIEAEREDGRWVHLKRVIATNARTALTGEDA